MNDKDRPSLWKLLGIAIIASCLAFSCQKTTDSPVTKSSDKAITAFSFASPVATGTIDESAKTISLNLPAGTKVTALVASFTASTGASVSVGGTAQVSGTTANDFTKSVTYTVTAADSSTASYVVTVTVEDPVKLLVWGWDETDGKGGHEYITKLIGDFKAANADIAVTYVAVGDAKLKDGAALFPSDSSGPDIFQAWGGGKMGSYADEGKLLDLSSELAGLSARTVAIQAMSWKGKVYGVAPSFSIGGLYANAKIFSDSGIAIPTTVAEMETAAAALKAKGIQPFAVGEKDKWPALNMYMYLVNRKSGDAYGQAKARTLAFDSSAFVDAASIVKDWNDKGYFGTDPQNESYNDALSKMTGGTAAMMVVGSWVSDNFTNATGGTISLVSFPTISGGLGSSTDMMGMSSIAFIAAKKAEAKKAAIAKFMKFAMTASVVSADTSGIPTISGVTPKNALASQAIALLNTATSVQFWWDQDLPATITTALTDTLYSFFASGVVVKDKLTAFEALASKTDALGPLVK
jgi:raffinose/stachyose/melibiose transport system substrate-binding protein